MLIELESDKKSPLVTKASAHHSLLFTPQNTGKNKRMLSVLRFLLATVKYVEETNGISSQPIEAIRS